MHLALRRARSRGAPRPNAEPTESPEPDTANEGTAKGETMTTEAEASPRPDGGDACDAETQPRPDPSDVTKKPARQSLWGVRPAMLVGLVVVVALGGLTGWFGWRGYQAHQAQQQRDLLVATGRQAALNLTTIDYTTVDADLQRILDSATGSFHDDFQQRLQPFAQVVKRAQSKSVGAITAAGLESQAGDKAQVLVALSVKTTMAGAPEPQPRAWRMRISLQRVGATAKVSDVQFVP